MWLSFDSISSSSMAPLSHFYTVDTGSYFGTLLEFYLLGAASRTASLKGYRDPMVYLQPNEGAFVRVFH